MYVSYMKSDTIPLAMPDKLLREIRAVAKDTGLSMADAMRQSMKLGLPKLREELGTSRITNVTPLPNSIARKLYSQPDDDADSIAQFMAAQSSVIEE
jgi:hypothetical protein